MPPIYVEVDDPKKDIRQQKIIEINYFCDECDKRLFPDQGDLMYEAEDEDGDWYYILCAEHKTRQPCSLYPKEKLLRDKAELGAPALKGD